MNTKQLKLFLLIADLKSFSKAAELEALTQPAVTQQIIRLEREVGASLFRRRHKKTELTKKGRLFYRFAKNMLSMVENLQRELRILDLKDSDVLKIGSSHIPTSSILHKAIVNFKKKNPNVYVIYEMNDTGTISFMVENELIDLGFVGAKVNGEFNYKSYSGDDLVLVCNEDSNMPERITLEGLKEIPLILNQKESGVRCFLEKKLNDYGININDLNVISEIGLPDTLINIVKMGMGCAFIPSIVVDREINKGGLRIVDIENFIAHREYYILTKFGKKIPNIASDFLNYFLSLFD